MIQMKKIMIALALMIALLMLPTAFSLARPSSPASAASANTLPACKNDDGSASARICVWDARHQGDGRGKSFIKVGSRFTTISHRTAHRLTR